MKYREKTINNRLWRVNKFTGSESFKILIQILKRIGPGLSKAVSGIQGGGSFLNSKIDPETLAAGLSELVLSLDDEKDFQFIMRLLRQTTIDNHEVTTTESFDLLFQDDLLDLFKGLVFVFETNYKSFLAASDFLKDPGQTIQ